MPFPTYNEFYIYITRLLFTHLRNRRRKRKKQKGLVLIAPRFAPSYVAWN